ncbi:MAG: NADH-quinone oxidoreductase subunit N [Dissulfurispiraceae bacterium]
MTPDDLIVLLPLIVIASASVVVMLGIAVYRSHLLTASLTFYAMYLAILSLGIAYSASPRQVTPLIIIDKFAILYMALILLSGVAVVILSFGYLKKHDIACEEFYLLLLLAMLGSMVLVCSSHFASFFLGLEVLSVSLYALIAYPKSWIKHIEAGMKYLVLAAVSSAFLLLGMALIYADVGSMTLSVITYRAAHNVSYTLPFIAGLALMTVGIGFKLALVPFHMWTPDVYEGAPAPVAAFIATVSKGAVFALLLRYFMQTNFLKSDSLFLVFSFVSFVSMVVGNLLALFQNNIKRVLAYSSIAHMGYLLVAFLSGGALSAQIVSFYLVTYFVTTFGAFGIITLLSDNEKDADDIDDYRGMSSQRPLLAAVFTAMLFSLAGIPLTAGFIGKFYLVTAGASAGLWVLVVTLALSSVIGLFYYLRIIFSLYSQPLGEQRSSRRNISLAGGMLVAVLLILLLWIGVYPAPLMDGIRLLIGMGG